MAEIWARKTIPMLAMLDCLEGEIDTWDLVSYYSAFSGTEVPCRAI
jgi:hypothetical protein